MTLKREKTNVKIEKIQTQNIIHKQRIIQPRQRQRQMEKVAYLANIISKCSLLVSLE